MTLSRVEKLSTPACFFFRFFIRLAMEEANTAGTGPQGCCHAQTAAQTQLREVFGERLFPISLDIS